MRTFLSAVAIAAMATTAVAKPALKDVKEISDGLIVFGIANEIRENCDSITPRLIRAYQYITGLKSRAEALGYTEAEIDAYVDDDAEEARLMTFVNRYMAARGVVTGNPDTYCTLGREEIKAGSEIGRLLKAR